MVISAFANGVGKTAINIAILGALMWGAPSTAFDYPLYREWPERWPKRIRIATESELVNAMGPIATESALWWPRDRYEWSKGGKTYNRFLTTDTGFFAEVMTYEQAVKEFEGKTNAVTLFIEPPPRPILYACFARQRKGGMNMIDMTPLMSSAYIKDEFVDKPEVIVDGVPVGKVKCITADIEENCIEHGEDGQLEHRDIVQIISRYDPDEVDARAHGKFMHLAGRIYKSFDREVHVAKQEFLPPTDEQISIGMVVDPAIGKPCAIAWYYADKTGTVHFWDEYPEFEFHNAADSNFTVKDYCELIAAKEKGLPVDTRILDRHFGNVRRTLGGKTLKEEFAEAGMWFQDSYSLDVQAEVETGIMKVNSYLRYDKSKPIDSLNRPKVRISPKCRNLIAAFEKWGRSPITGKPQEEFKDFMDLARYVLMTEPSVPGPKPSWEGEKAHYGVNNT